MTDGNEFRKYMKAANRTLSQNDDQHLSEAQVIAYYRGKMTGAERELAQTHLVDCEECLALFRSAGDFLEPAAPDETAVTTQELEDAWSSVWQRTQPEPAVVQGDFKRPTAKRGFFGSRVTLALAASLLISFGALGGATWRIVQERRSLRESQATVAQLSDKQRELEAQLAQAQQGAGDQLKQEREQRIAAETKRDQLQSQLTAAQQNWENIPVYTARLSAERGPDEDLHLDFKTAATLVQLIISKPFDYPEFVVQILDQRGEMVREVSGLRPTGDAGALSFRLDRATLSSGKYKLRLLGRRGKATNLVGEYALTVN